MRRVGAIRRPALLENCYDTIAGGGLGDRQRPGALDPGFEFGEREGRVERLVKATTAPASRSVHTVCGREFISLAVGMPSNPGPLPGARSTLTTFVPSAPGDRHKRLCATEVENPSLYLLRGV